jgi:hypothetical protein
MIKVEKDEATPASTPTDPVLAMRGVGKHLWANESAEVFVERLRKEEDGSQVQSAPGLAAPPSTDGIEDLVWARLKAHQGEVFFTATRLPFTYQIEGNGLWFFREGDRINRKLTRAQVNTGVARCPIAKTTEIADLIDYAYLFGLLTDSRVRGEQW